MVIQNSRARIVTHQSSVVSSTTPVTPRYNFSLYGVSFSPCERASFPFMWAFFSMRWSFFSLCGYFFSVPPPITKFSAAPMHLEQVSTNCVVNIRTQ